MTRSGNPYVTIHGLDHSLYRGDGNQQGDEKKRLFVAIFFPVGAEKK